MNDDPRIYPDSGPDRLAIAVRGVCGGLLGLAVATGVWIRSGGFGPWGSVALFVTAIAGCAWGAIRHGDDFWLAVLKRRS